MLSERSEGEEKGAQESEGEGSVLGLLWREKGRRGCRRSGREGRWRGEEFEERRKRRRRREGERRRQQRLLLPQCPFLPSKSGQSSAPTPNEVETSLSRLFDPNFHRRTDSERKKERSYIITAQALCSPFRSCSAAIAERSERCILWRRRKVSAWEKSRGEEGTY